MVSKAAKRLRLRSVNGMHADAGRDETSAAPYMSPTRRHLQLLSRAAKPRAYCKQYAEDDIANVVSMRFYEVLQNLRLRKIPPHSVQGRKHGAYCELHAEDGMGDIRDKCFSHDTFPWRPWLNQEGIRTPTCCNSMLRIIWSTSTTRGASMPSALGPFYKVEGRKTAASYCKQHAAEDILTFRPESFLNATCTKASYFPEEWSKMPAYC